MTAPLVIAYCGNFRPDHSTETHLARTLEQMGHKVTRIQEDTTNPAMLTRRLQREDMDLFFYTRTWGKTVDLTHLDLLSKRGVPSVSYHLDLYVGVWRGGPADAKSDANIGTDPFWKVDYVFQPDRDPESARVFAAKGVNQRWLPPGVVADECYIADVSLQRDVIFVGSGPDYHKEWPYRGQLLRWLESTYGGRYSQHGNRGRPVRGDDLNRLYASTRVAVGDSFVPGFNRYGYCSDRRYEAPGRGAFQIGPRIDGLDDGFVDGVNCVLYDFGDWDGLKDRIDHYLKAADEREKIRRAGHEHVRQNHTYTHRLERMFEILYAEGAL